MKKGDEEQKGEDHGRRIRSEAETKFARDKKLPDFLSKMSQDELIHELRVHQIELEMQNDELKRAQSLIDESCDKYVDLYDSFPVGYFTLSRDVVILGANLTAATLLGVDRQKLINQRFRNFISPADVERWDRYIVEKFRRGRKDRYEILIKRPDGAELTVQIDIIRVDLPLVVGRSQETVVHALITDVTSRKHAEDALRASNEQFMTLANLAPVGIYLADSDGNCQYANTRWCEMAGLSFEEALGKGWMKGLHPDDRTHVLSAWQKMVESEGKWGMEYRFRAPDGKITVVYGLAAPQRDASGKIVRYVGVNTDITERKRSEEALKKVGERLLLATVGGGVGIWDLDVVNNKLIWDDQMFRLYGASPDNFAGAYEAWKSRVHPEDLERGDAEVQMALRGEKAFDTEFRVVWPDGTIHHIRACATVHRDAAGRPMRLIGTNYAVTELKQMEEHVKRSNAEWEKTFNSISDLVFIQDPNMNIVKVNKACADVLKMDPKDIIGKKCYEIMHDLNHPWPCCPFEKTTKDHCAHSQKVDDPHLGIPYDITVSPIIDESGKMVGAVHIARDMSENKKIEEKLRQRLDELEVFYKASIGREERILELKKEIEDMKRK